LFRLHGRPRIDASSIKRLVVAEAPIDAMSVAAIEHPRWATLYTATAGGMGPGTIAALECQLQALAAQEGGKLAIATDNDSAGRGSADRLTEMARALVKISPPTPGKRSEGLE
jgi:Toprim-like